MMVQLQLLLLLLQTVLTNSVIVKTVLAQIQIRNALKTVLIVERTHPVLAVIPYRRAQRQRGLEHIAAADAAADAAAVQPAGHIR